MVICTFCSQQLRGKYPCADCQLVCTTVYFLSVVASTVFSPKVKSSRFLFLSLLLTSFFEYGKLGHPRCFCGLWHLDLCRDWGPQEVSRFTSSEGYLQQGGRLLYPAQNNSTRNQCPRLPFDQCSLFWKRFCNFSHEISYSRKSSLVAIKQKRKQAHLLLCSSVV